MLLPSSNRVLLIKAFPILSRDSAPIGSLHLFRLGQVPLSVSLQNSIRFFRTPLPAYLSAHLTVCFPCIIIQYGDNRAYHVPLTLLNDLGFAYPPRESQSTQHESRTCWPYPLPFGLSLSAPLAYRR